MAYKIRPKILINSGRINEPIRVPISDLLVKPIAETFPISDTASGVTSLTVKNITGFDLNQILLIGETNNESTEIAYTDSAVSPTGSTVTLLAATTQPHSSGSRIRVMPFDQIEFSTAATTTGTKSVLILMDIDPTSDETALDELTVTSGYYFARFYNSILDTYSPYSDPVPVAGYSFTTARSIIDNALDMINKQTSTVLSDEFFFNQINNCQIETLREFKRWSFMQSFNTIVGQTATGRWKVQLPADCDDQNTTKSIWNFRIGKELQLLWVDKEDWNDIVGDFAATTLAQDINVGDMTIYLDSSADFYDTGTVNIGSNPYTYSANDRSTGALTIPASTTTNTEGDDVFQNAFTGNPLYWTTYGGWIYHWPITNEVYAERNYYMDYYKKLVPIVTDADEIVLPDPTIVQYYCAWKALLKIANGEQTTAAQGMYEQYLLRREKAKQKESLNREFYLLPDDDYL